MYVIVRYSTTVTNHSNMQIRGSNVKPGKVERELIILQISDGRLLSACASHNPKTSMPYSDFT
jgi:hypothetical protein